MYPYNTARFGFYIFLKQNTFASNKIIKNERTGKY